MAIGTGELDAMQKRYKGAVDAWIMAIRAEEAIASGCHNETQIDAWEGAAFRQEDAAKQAHLAKKSYEAALREEFFNF